MCLSSCTFSCLFGFRSSSSPPWSLARDRCRDRSRDCCKNPRTVGTVEKDLLILTPPSNGPYGPWVFTTVPGAVPTTVPGQGPRDQKKRKRSPCFVYSASCAAGEAPVSSTRHRVLSVINPATNLTTVFLCAPSPPNNVESVILIFVILVFSPISLAQHLNIV